MNTKTKHDYASIANDGRRVHDAALEDLKVAAFKKRVSARELDGLLANIQALEESEAQSASCLREQVVAAETEAKERAALASALANVRDDAKLRFGRRSKVARGFGLGFRLGSESSKSMKKAAEFVLATASRQTKQAAEIGLDAAAVRRLKELVTALLEAVGAHASATQLRHRAASLATAKAKAVIDEVAQLRLAARRVFRDDPQKLERYTTGAPRYTPTARPKTPVAAPTTPVPTATEPTASRH